MPGRTLNLKTLFAALAFMALAGTHAHAAPLVISTPKFSITFPDGWASLAYPGLPTNNNDSSQQIYDSTLGIFAHLLVRTSDHPPTAQELALYLTLYGGGTGTEKTGDGTKTLGGKSFPWAEYKSTDTSDADTRVRFYYTVSGNTLFYGFMAYDIKDMTAAIASFEAGLATLNLPVGIRTRLAVTARPDLRVATMDILGRARPLALRTPLFRAPSL